MTVIDSSLAVVFVFSEGRLTASHFENPCSIKCKNMSSRKMTLQRLKQVPLNSCFSLSTKQSKVPFRGLKHLILVPLLLPQIHSKVSVYNLPWLHFDSRQAIITARLTSVELCVHAAGACSGAFFHYNLSSHYRRKWKYFLPTCRE